MSKPLVIYHANCPDGFGGAYAAWKVFADKAEYHPGKFGEAPPSCVDRTVILIDFSYSAELLVEIAASAQNVIILDHHQTAEKNLTPLLAQQVIQGEFDMNRSGAVMAWHYFHPGQAVPPLLEYIQDRDLWRLALEDTHAVNMALRGYPMEFTVWDKLMADVPKLVTEGRPIYRYFLQELESFKKQARRAIIGGVEVPFVNAPKGYASDLAGELAENQPFACVYYDSATARNYSLRAREGGMNVAEIAEQYGGGGHARASGFRQELPWVSKV